MVAPISTLTTLETPLCNVIMSEISSRCQEPKCSPHNVQTHQAGLSEGCSNQTESWLENVVISLPVNECLNEKTLAGTLCAPHRLYFCLYICK